MAISEERGVITHSSSLPGWARVFVGLLGLVTTILGPATMVSIAAPGLTLSFALTVFTGAVLLLFGLFALMVSLSAAETLEFRISERTLVVSKRGPLGRSRRQHDFADVGAPALAMRESEDGPYPVLTLRLSGSRSPLTMASFSNADDAQHWQQRLIQILGQTG